MENQTPEQIAQHFKAMGDSVWLIKPALLALSKATLVNTL